MQVDFFLMAANRRAHRLRPERSYVLGREEGVDIRVDDALLSRRHLRLNWLVDEPGWQAEDLGSRNGTTINGTRLIGSQLLHDQDRIQLGGQVYQYLMLPPGTDLGQLSDQAPKIQNDATLGPDLTPADLFTQGAAFTGSVGEGGVLELLQFFALTRKTGRLDLARERGQLGWLELQEGTVRAAEHDGQCGFDALVELIISGPERFAFHAAAGLQAEATIAGSTEAVLFELARVLDERERDA